MSISKYLKEFEVTAIQGVYCRTFVLVWFLGFLGFFLVKSSKLCKGEGRSCIFKIVVCFNSASEDFKK